MSNKKRKKQIYTIILLFIAPFIFAGLYNSLHAVTPVMYVLASSSSMSVILDDSEQDDSAPDDSETEIASETVIESQNNKSHFSIFDKEVTIEGAEIISSEEVPSSIKSEGSDTTVSAFPASGGRDNAAINDSQTVTKRVELSIDTEHVYEGMDASYSDGYIPTVNENTVLLVIPFLADDALMDGKLTVTVESVSDAPFIKTEYEEEVLSKTWKPDTTNGSVYVPDTQGNSSYVFYCTFTLAQTYVSGQYPITVKATGYSENGEKTEMLCRITVILMDESIQEPESESETEGETELGTEPESKSELESESDTEPAPEYESEPDTEPASESETSVSDTEPTGEPETESESEPDTESESESETEDVYTSSGSSSYYSASGDSSGSSSSVKHQPHILLEECTLSGSQLLAGEQMNFTASFRNTSEDQSVYSLKITVKTADENIALATTSYYFDQVSPQEVIPLDNTIAASVAAAQKVTTLSYTFEYETSEGSLLIDSEELFFDISQETQVSIEDFNLSDYVYSMETVTASLEIRNTGRGPVYNVQVSLEADGLSATNTVYAGNMEAGTSSDGTIRIYVGTLNDSSGQESSQEAVQSAATTDGSSAYGSTTGTLTLTWEDAYGTVYTSTREFATTIASPQIVELTVEAEEEASSNQWWAAAVVVLILLFLTVLAILLRRLTSRRHQVEDLLARMEGPQS